MDATIGLRTKPEAEFQGLDFNEHGEDGYGEEIDMA
jgi:Amt family ammonium transporter